MSPVAPQQPFISSVLSAAIRCAADTGLYTSVVLAQWADETAWGTSKAWVYGHNPAGISPDGVIASYPSTGAGFAAWVATMNHSAYNPVREAKAIGPLSQAYALGESPWAAGHYIAEDRPAVEGSALVEIILDNDLTDYDGTETLVAGETPTTPPPAAEPQEWAMQCTDPKTGKVLAADATGNLYKTPAIGPTLVVATLGEHPTYHAGEAESGGANPCVGITPWADPNGEWGWCFVTKPTTPNPAGFGPYELYRFGRNGKPNGVAA